ncbi:hypothetical protein [Nocardia sp. CS682]|uniref:hypothetical protein n=1 Tax=Nocardia sp. CS682 TaxID=1047172 RepID=UPI001074EE3E|nr:hypothetical protein [Nocardia sp. CS682]QBS43862.1 hypothetical protein DMB37_30970 [Nocardia sp. CS682]
MRFKPDSAGLAAYLKTSPHLRSILVDRAEIVVALYRDSLTRKTGRNAREVRVFTALGGARRDRLMSVVHAYSPYAAFREWGTKRNPAERGLRDALQQLGEL